MDGKQNSFAKSAFRAGAILSMEPGRPLINDGVLLAAGGQILELGSYQELKKDLDVPLQDLGSSTIMAPGLINAHTHLELCHLQGQTRLGQGFESWVQSLIRLPLQDIDADLVQTWILELGNNGTVCIGDISSYNPRKIYSRLQKSDLYCRLFIEFLGFSGAQSQKLQWPKGINPKKQKWISLSGHALYSTHPGILQMTKDWTLQNKRPFALHLAEHAGEVDLLTTGRGGLAELLRGVLLPDDYVAPGMSPVMFADNLGLLDQHTLAVHCVHLTGQDLNILQQRGCFVCLCPRSNNNINVGRAPWEKMMAAGIPLCLGTDSLASNHDLDLWAEAEHLLLHSNKGMALEDLLGLMTVNPARILGLDKLLGSLQPGKKALFCLVPERLQDLLL